MTTSNFERDGIPKISVFESIHGSYQQAAGKDIANPIATILSVEMMFEYSFNLMEEGKIIRDAVAASMEEGYVTTDNAEGKSYKTSEMGDWIAKWIENNWETNSHHPT